MLGNLHVAFGGRRLDSCNARLRRALKGAGRPSYSVGAVFDSREAYQYKQGLCEISA